MLGRRDVDLVKYMDTHVRMYEMYSSSIQSLQNPFCTNHLALPAPLPPHSPLDRNRQTLKHRLALMMIVLPRQHIHMQRHPRRLTETLQAMTYHLGCQAADGGVAETGREGGGGEKGAGGNVDDGAGEGFIEGRIGVGEAGETGAGAKGGGEGAAEEEEGVFGGVVVVD